MRNGFIAVLVFLTFIVAAAPGDIDLSFDPGTGLNGNVQVIATDGKLIIGGTFTTVRSVARNSFARLNFDGSADLTFNPPSFIHPDVHSVAVQPDGKILYCDYQDIRRLNSNGSLDSSFTTYYGYPRAIALQSDGKVVLGTDTGVNRLKTDGTIDPTFFASVNNIGLYGVTSVVVQSDGKVLIAGDFDTVNGTNRNHIARLNTNGVLDTTFDPGTGADDRIEAVALLSSGKIVVAGSFTQFNSATYNHIVRLNANGTVDSTFAATGTDRDIYSLAVQTNKVLIGGAFHTVNGTTRSGLARLNDDGSLDTSFTGTADYVNSIGLIAGGKIAIGGAFTVNGTHRPWLALLNPNGTTDTTFDPNRGFDDVINAVAVQTNGKIVVGGYFNEIAPATNWLPGIARLNTDGTKDAGFNPTNSGARADVVALQPDGKILYGGYSVFVGTKPTQIARLNIDGTTDTTFNPTTGLLFRVQAIALQSNGQIIMGGPVSYLNSYTSNRVWRLNANGSVDPTFNSGTIYTEPYRTLQTVAIQTDGKLLIGGGITNINGTASTRVARLNSDGSVDNTFNVGSGPDNTVVSLLLQPDGKILVSGYFYYFNGTAGNGLVRLNPDGSIDKSFTAAEGGAYSMTLQSDGRIILGLPRGAARLNTDGSLDTSIPTLDYDNSDVYATAVQPDGKILLGGYFNAVNGTLRQCLARVWGDPRLEALRVGNNIVLTWPPGDFELQASSTSVGTFINVVNAISPYTNSMTSGQKFYRLKGF